MEGTSFIMRADRLINTRRSSILPSRVEEYIYIVKVGPC